MSYGIETLVHQIYYDARNDSAEEGHALLFQCNCSTEIALGCSHTLHRTLTVSQQDQLGEFEPEFSQQREVEVPQDPAAGLVL